MFSKYSKRDRRRFPFVAAMLAFPILQFLVFYVYLNMNTFVLAFTDTSGNFTMANFAEVWKEWNNPSLLNLKDSLVRSMITWGLDVFIVFPITVVFTYALFKKVKGEMVFRVIFFLPGILGSVVTATLFRYLLDGPLSDIFYKLGWVSEEVYQMGFFYGEASFTTVLVYGIWLGLCGNIVVFTGAMSRIPTDVLEYAKIDGVGFFREFRSIVLPLIWPTLSTSLIYKLATVFSADYGTYLLTGLGNKGATTMGYYLFNILYNLVQSGDTSKAHYPAAVGVVITLITLPFVMIVRHILDKHTEDIVY
jgi:multiple sugar transport system permease protein/N-acetylglucosamine transport system permease protein